MGIVSRPFLLATLGTFVLLGLATGVLYTKLFFPVEKDQMEYWKLMAQADPSIIEADTAPYKATQERKRIFKEIWFTQGGQNLQLHLYGDNAELVIDRAGSATEITEHLHHVLCYMQEELYYILEDGTEVKRTDDGWKTKDSAKAIDVDISEATPMQIVRVLEADHAVYYYQRDHLLAEQALVSRHIIPGHTLNKALAKGKILMSGKAQFVEFSLTKGDINFKAYQFKARLLRSRHF